MKHFFHILFTFLVFNLSAHAQRFDLGKVDCRGTMQPNQASWTRQGIFEGKGFSLWNDSNRYEQNFYDLTTYKKLPNGAIRGERVGESNFNKFQYVVEVTPTTVNVLEVSIPHHDRKEIRHTANCVLRKPMSAIRFEDLFRQVR